MRIARKVYMSIFTTLFILITCVATTFAWVGMFTTATLGSFDINLKVVNVDAEYFLTISNSGNANSFGDRIESVDLKKQILENMGYNTDSLLPEGIDSYFSQVAIMEPVTTDSNLTDFYSMTNLSKKSPFLSKDNRLYKYDLYLSVDTKEGIAGLSQTEIDALDINANVFFDNIADALIGTNNTGSLVDSNPFSTIPSNSEYSCLKNINPQSITINTKNATRLAFQIYEPITMNSSYDGTEIPMNTIIYQGGKQLPSVTNDVYDLGGILPEEYNLALKEINKIYKTNVDLDTLYVDTNGNGEIDNFEKSPFIGAKERYNNSVDKEMVEANNKIWVAPSTVSGTNYLGIKDGIQTKMKISVYFWYEGYDADCLRLVDFLPTSFEIVLSTDKNII